MPWLFKQKGSENWWVGYRSGGKQHRHTTGTPDKTKAEAELARIEALLEAKRSDMLTESAIAAITGRQPPKIMLRQEAQSWLSQVDHTTEDNTAARYRGIIETFTRHFKATEDGPLLSDLTTEQIRAFFNDRLKTVAPATVNVERKILRMFFKQACESGALKANPILPIKHFKGKSKVRRQPFTVKQLSDIYTAATHEWQYMTLGGFYTGLRMGDLATLRWETIDWDSRVFNTRDDKTDKSLHIPIAPRLFDWLEKEWVRQGKPGSGYIVSSLAEIYNSGSGALSNAFYKLMKDAGIQLPERAAKHRGTKSGRSGRRQTNPLSFHSLRHSFISFLKSTGASQAIAKELAGHSSDALSDLYTHTPVEVLTEAVAKLPRFTE